ncbi:MAG TPA: hypothetical protein VMV81_10275 [Phycisphaerae bacterium]|nr:hypothetical protein [Phycisphaerae bacterium]
MSEPDRPISIFLSFEPDVQVCADKVNQWPITNADFAVYNRRVDISCDDPAAGALRQAVERQIGSAEVFICFIASMHPDPWLLWEIAAAKSAGKGLVGILLKDYLEPPQLMRNCGAVFISFKKDMLERAVAFAAEEGRDLTEDYLLSED